MSKSNLHPKVQEFKEFVKRHPQLVSKVRGGTKTWQDLYEEWSILGEADEIWKKYKQAKDEPEATEVKTEKISKESDVEDNSDEDKSKNPSFQLADILALLKSVNLDDIQGHINNLSGVMKTLQGLVSSFQSNSPSSSNSSSSSNSQQQQPFNYRQF
ncbi:MAG: YlbD family protein [Bacillaceae bacterium]|nr:YlbD family protein [Bacillaceae bacterium]